MIAALVTGAAGGIGRATALRFAQAGASVMVSDVNAQGGEETVAMIVAAGGTAHFHRADVSEEADVAALINATLAAYGRIDWAFNNAGIIGPIAGIADTSAEEFDRVVAVNLRSIFLCMRAELAVMAAQGTGAIVNTASETVLKGNAGPAAYTASKRGVQGLTEHAALEYAKSGIRINSVAPGAIVTPMTLALRAKTERPSPQPNGRRGEASEIAEAVYWLCSDAASNVIGHMLVVDGGWAIA
ncbi:MAG: SDR family oxidoreductase [Sphingomonadales bacterium]|nr:MAG: SDR family oxidoreductase [Sphingomonadales bacterium]